MSDIQYRARSLDGDWKWSDWSLFPLGGQVFTGRFEIQVRIKPSLADDVHVENMISLSAEEYAVIARHRKLKDKMNRLAQLEQQIVELKKSIDKECFLHGPNGERL